MSEEIRKLLDEACGMQMRLRQIADQIAQTPASGKCNTLVELNLREACGKILMASALYKE